MSGTLNPLEAALRPANPIASLNTSIPLAAGQGVKQVDPLQQIGQFASASNAINQLKLFPGQQQLQQQAVQSGQIGLAQHINQATAAAMAPLMAEPIGSITHDKATNAMAIAEAQHIPTGYLASALGNFPQGDGPAFDKSVRAWILSNAQPPQNAAAAVLPGQTTINTGPRIQPGIVGAPGLPGQGGFTPSGAPIETFPPRSYGRVQTGVDAKGNPTFAPESYVTPPSISGLPPNSIGPGRLPPALINPNSPQMTGQTTQLGPAATANLAKTGSDAAAGFSQVAERGNQAVQQNVILGNMQNDLAQSPVSGTGSDYTLAFKRALVSWVPGIASSFGVDPKSVATTESFEKLAAQLADAQGAGSDQRLNMTVAANPHLGLSPAGLDYVIRQLQGNSDYLRAVQQLAGKWDQQDYRGFSAKIANSLDPRFFQLNRLTGDQQADYLAALPPGEKADFKRKYLAARAQGLLGQ